MTKELKENIAYWEAMHRTGEHGESIATDEYREKYLDFMYNRKNVGNCSHCPENRGYFPHADRPCGQQNCWVTCHCNA